MKNRNVFTCCLIIVSIQVTAQADSIGADSSVVTADTSIILLSDSLTLVDSLSSLDSVVAVVDSLSTDSLSDIDQPAICISDMVVLPVISFGPYTYPWYPTWGSLPGIPSYTVTVLDWSPPPFPVRSYEDLIDPPSEVIKPDHTFVVYTADNFTPVPEEKEPEPDSLPFVPDLKWIAALSPTPFRSRK